MPLTVEHHVTFWRTLAKGLEDGTPLLSCIEHARGKLQGIELERAAEQIIRDITAGAALSEAMSAHELAFSKCVQTMVRAGEAGGVLDVIAGRIVEGLQDGSFPLPGAAAKEDDSARWWRAFGRLLSSGVPILQALDLLVLEVAGPRFAEATQAIRQAILEGSDLASALLPHPGLFPEEVRLAVANGEQRGELDEQVFAIADALTANDLPSLVPDGAAPDAGGGTSADAAPVVKLVNRVILQGIRSRVSDIHFDPLESGLRIRYRVDGVLQEAEAPPAHLAAAILSRVKIMASMDIAERRLPQDGRIMLKIEGKLYDVRVSAVPTVLGERVVLRILDREAVRFDLERIGLLPDDLAAVRKLCALPNGVVICNGPAGSGKTTLLYAMLMAIDRTKSCVMSVEDPVEYRLEGIGQIQIARLGLTYARALRSILRQDPDVIMVGEIRDQETLQVAVQCSLTGHLVLSTLHANTSPGAVRRLLDIGLEPFLVNSTLAGVVSQRLVRVLCKDCKQAVEPQLHSVPPAAAEFIREHPDATFYGPKGCDACRGMGYRGRTAIHEILVPDDRVHQVVAAQGDAAAIRDAALAAGMRPMLLCGLEKAALGLTSIQEVCRVVSHGLND